MDGPSLRADHRHTAIRNIGGSEHGVHFLIAAGRVSMRRRDDVAQIGHILYTHSRLSTRAVRWRLVGLASGRVVETVDVLSGIFLG